MRARTTADLLDLVATHGGLSDVSTRPVVAAVLRKLRELVPEEAADIASVLPAELRALWQAA